MVTMPTINHNGTSLVELLEQHELAIAGLRSAISTLAAAAPNARDLSDPKAGIVRAGAERTS